MVRNRRTKTLRLSLLVLVLLGPWRVAVAEGDAASAEAAVQEQVTAAVERGLDWIERHPASVEDGGLTDVLDEAVSFRVLSTLPGDKALQKRFADAFGERIARLGALPEFTQWVNAWRKQPTDYYHLLLAAYLMRQAGTPTSLQSAIVAQAQWFLASSPFCDPTKRLTIALFLQRLGEKPAVALSDVLAAGRIERIARGDPPELPADDVDSKQRVAAALDLYSLVHEVIALTDFGREPPTPWLAERLAPLQAFLLQAIAWAGANGNIDLLSELLMTSLFIDTPLQAVWPDATRQLLSSQQDDGSWGPSEDTRRLNKYRHAVFTATTALSALRADE